MYPSTGVGGILTEGEGRVQQSPSLTKQYVLFPILFEHSYYIGHIIIASNRLATSYYIITPRLAYLENRIHSHKHGRML